MLVSPDARQVMTIFSSPVRRSHHLIGQPGVVSRSGQDWRPAHQQSGLWEVRSCNITHNFPSLMARLSLARATNFSWYCCGPGSSRSKRGREKKWSSRYSDISLGPVDHGRYLDTTFVSFCVSLWSAVQLLLHYWWSTMHTSNTRGLGLSSECKVSVGHLPCQLSPWELSLFLTKAKCQIENLPTVLHYSLHPNSWKM